MYTDFYGLAGPPFQLTPDARFWFDSRTHKKAMAYLGYGLAQGEGFITITGEIGAGKSTLIAHLLDRIDRQRLRAIPVVSTQVEGDDMLRLVAQGLDLGTEGIAKALLLERVEQRLEEEYRGGKRTLVLVDEAQNLPISALEELRMLSNFQLDGRALVQIVLLGQPEFRDKIAGPGLEQLRQRVIATHHLEAMGADEIEAYVRHRLEVAGWRGRPDFGDGLFDALYRYTGGIPRRLNQLLNRLFLHGAVEQLSVLDGAAVDAVADDMEKERALAEMPGTAPVATPEAPAAVSAPVQAPQRAEGPRPSDIATAARIAALEEKVAEQEATLRRVLTLMIDWIEREPAPAPAPERRPRHQAA